MGFSKFESLTNHYNQKAIDAFSLAVPKDSVWMATEKVHGSNFSIWYNGVDFKFGRRTGFLEDGEKFYHYPSAMTEELLTSVKRLFEIVPCSELTVYGELYGKGVQKGVDYSMEENGFVAFHLRIDEVDIAPSLALNQMRIAGVDTVPAIAFGTLDQLIGLDNDINSTLAIRNGLAGDVKNISEGLVIVPADGVYHTESGKRVAIKSKNDKFKEACKERRPIKQEKDLGESGNELLATLSRYATENRVNNVVSKIGDLNEKDFGRVLGLTIKDIIDEASEDIGSSIQGHEMWKPVVKSLKKHVAEVIRPVFISNYG